MTTDLATTRDHATLPNSCHVGAGVRIAAGALSIGNDVRLEDGVTIVGDSVDIGDGARIGPGSDLRAATMRLGAGSEIGAGVRVLVAEHFETGPAARICTGCQIVCRSFTAGALLYFGEQAAVGFGGTTTSTAHVRIGDRVTIGQFAILNANLPIEIGDDVGTGSYLGIWTHGYHFGHGPLTGTDPSYAPVRIGRNVWLGFRVTLLPGVSIGDDSQVAAGAVVTTDIPDRVLAAGVPAKIKKCIDVSPVTDHLALAAAARVLHAWRTELEWKGCTVSMDAETPERVSLRATTADGMDRIQVVLTAAPFIDPPGVGTEPLVRVNISARAYTSAVGPDETVFDLRSGQLHGRRSILVEDLRDQFRRHAMPCGDDSCFTSIEPEPFARLRGALTATGGEVTP
ncbi:MAG: DapH/DapD/GlmU-related protein [Dermatophilaceae bacterium]